MLRLFIILCDICHINGQKEGENREGGWTFVPKFWNNFPSASLHDFQPLTVQLLAGKSSPLQHPSWLTKYQGENPFLWENRGSEQPPPLFSHRWHLWQQIHKKPFLSMRPPSKDIGKIGPFCIFALNRGSESNLMIFLGSPHVHL